MWSYNYTDELYHYGVPGMRWKNHTYAQRPVSTGRRLSGASAAKAAMLQARSAKRAANKAEKARLKLEKQKMSNINSKAEKTKSRLKKAAIIGGAALATGAAVYGANKLRKNIRAKNKQLYINAAQDEIRRNFRNTQQWLANERAQGRTNVKAGFSKVGIINQYKNAADRDNIFQATKNVYNASPKVRNARRTLYRLTGGVYR